MADLILNTRFENGQELTHHELREAYKRITGRELPRGAKSQDVARHFVTTCPLRFEFEVNRLRGFAWDAGEMG
jgi:hypothetical protein